MVTDSALEGCVRRIMPGEAGLALPQNGAFADLVRVPEGPFVISEKAEALARVLEVILQAPVQVIVAPGDEPPEVYGPSCGYSEAFDLSICPSITIRFWRNPSELPYGERARLQDVLDKACIVLPWAVRYEMGVQRDGLTGLTNKATLETLLAHDIERLKREEHFNGGSKGMGVIAMDIDYFKRYNDGYGHARGDVVLQHVAGYIRECVRRRTDIVSRLGRTGGEEFVIVLQGCDKVNAERIAEDLRSYIERKSGEDMDPSDETKLPKPVTVSVGVVHTSSITKPARYDPSIVLKIADARLYAAKDSGRNRVEAAYIPDGMGELLTGGYRRERQLRLTFG